MLEILKAILFGVVEGITEWLPISSTGHMILLDEFVKLNVSEEFWNLFLVVIQLGAILAVVVLFWNKIWPFQIAQKAPNSHEKNSFIKRDIIILWLKILVACIPAGIVGVLFDDVLDKYLYNFPTVAAMLLIFGILFILIENRNQDKKPQITDLSEITYTTAVLIGVFQLIAAIFPGTSRSGATIIGALMIGVSRTVAAEFTFFLAIPVMFGASLLKIVKYVLDVGFVFSTVELVVLLVGVVVAFVVSMLVIRFLMGYIKKHNFIPFGWYRIVLGIILLGYYFLFA